MAALRRLKWIAASLGRKPAATTSLAMVLTAADLPGVGWRQLDERTWRTGVDANSDWAQRARRMKSVTAWRSFENPESSRGVWCQAIPLASASVAHAGMRDVPSRLLRNLRAEVQVVTSKNIEPPSLANAEQAWAYEQHTHGPKGDGLSLMLAAAVEDAVGVVACSGFGASWQWTDVAMLFDRQAARIARRGEVEGSG